MKIRMSIDYDGWFRPYYMFRRSKSRMEAEYYGQVWFLLMHILFWEVVIWERP